MSRRGAKPKPTRLKALSGTLRSDRINDVCDSCRQRLEAGPAILVIPVWVKRTLHFCGVLCARNYLEGMCEERFGEVNPLGLPGHTLTKPPENPWPRG